MTFERVLVISFQELEDAQFPVRVGNDDIIHANSRGNNEMVSKSGGLIMLKAVDSSFEDEQMNKKEIKRN